MNARWTSPRLLPTVAVLALAVIGLGVTLPFVAGGDGGTTITTCKTKDDPGCTLREPIHEHADFAVFIRGQRVDFNQPRFVTEEGEETSPLAHIHPPRFTVAHVHISKTTWGEFFELLGIQLKDPSLVGVTEAQTCLKLPGGDRLCSNAAERFQFMVNAVRVDGVSQTEIHDLDRVLIAFGSETDEQLRALNAQVSDEACIPSERCKSRIPAGGEPEPCTGKGTTCAK